MFAISIFRESSLMSVRGVFKQEINVYDWNYGCYDFVFDGDFRRVNPGYLDRKENVVSSGVLPCNVEVGSPLQPFLAVPFWYS